MDLRKLQRVIIDALEDVKAQDIRVYDTTKLSELFDRVIIATGSSNRQTRSLAMSVKEDVNAKGGEVISIEGLETGEWVLVDCVSTYRVRYMVQVPKGKSEWALDTVTMEEAKEFSQEHIGEQIISHRVVSKKYALELSDIDNDYTVAWNEETKMKNFFTTLEDQNGNDYT